MSSTEGFSHYDPDQRRVLLETAARSIAQGLERHVPMDPQLSDYPPALCATRASFITLEIGHELRGCIGVLEACRPLIRDVAHNAFAAAFEDPRFPPLRAQEYPRLSIKVSVLSVPVPIDFASEADLVRQLKPGEDGLILRDARHRGTFLPSVWEQLPEPRDFLGHLKRKAGLPTDYWSDDIQVLRYGTESFGGPVP
ncbi:AmmeMemoRadiSam system protein A [Thiocystis violacea]|uniref:AmmeMemoRadiSam system protein A n=1 Tax=Thiocystis violacea TaxID=13725 RepID=UPI0019070F86|nr:AmmeMemoRadiSam system protein A [Thiocystis violacea]